MKVDEKVISLLKLAIISIMIPVCLHLFFKNKVQEPVVEEQTPKPFVQEDIDKSVKDLKGIVEVIDYQMHEIKSSENEEIDFQKDINELKDLISQLVHFNKHLSTMVTSNFVHNAETKLLNETNVLLEEFAEEPKEITWLGSPVSQAWKFDSKKQVWTTVLPFKESMRSPPTLVIGLREDGVVVWKEVKKEDREF